MSSFDPVKDYANKVLDGKIIAGPSVRAASARHLKDIDTGSQRSLWWDLEAAIDAIDFFEECLVFGDAQFDNQPFRLEPPQKFIVGSIFGWKTDEGNRRFQQAYVETGKGSGKALALDTPIATLSGWTTMGALRPGDYVFGSDGRPTLVIGAFDVMHGHDCFEVEFDDGEIIVADAEHLWFTEIETVEGLLSYGVRSTRDIRATLNSFCGRMARHRIQANGDVTMAGARIPLKDHIIAACRPCASVPVRCIRVAAADSLFLAGKSLVPTHNTPLAAGIGLKLFCADDEPSALVMCAAPTLKQAQKLAFQDAVGFVERNEELAAAIRLKGETVIEALLYDELKAEMLPISSDAKKKSGFRPSGLIVDEVHELGRNDELIHMLRAGFKYRRNPLLFMITNSGFDKQSVCWRERERARKAAAGVDNDDALFSYVCELDTGDDPLKSEKCWPKANPLLGTITQKPYLRSEIRAAKASGKINLCLRLNFCVWTGSDSTWLSPDLIDSCFHELTPEELDLIRPIPCRGALDLSKRRDLTALTLGWELSGGHILARSWFFLPEENLMERVEEDGAPYDEWARMRREWDGEPHLNTTPGPEVDYSFLARKIQQLQEFYKIEYLCFDPYKIEELKRELDAIGCDVKLTPHLQGASMTRQTGFWMPGAIQTLESAIINRRLIVEDSPPMRMCLHSVEAKTIDDQGNRLFSKRQSRRRIDGAVTLAMTTGALENGPEPVDDSPMVRFIRRGQRHV